MPDVPGPCATPYTWTTYGSSSETATLVCSGTTDADGKFCCDTDGETVYPVVTGSTDPDYDYELSYEGTASIAPGGTITVCLPPIDGLVCTGCGPVPETLTLNFGAGDVTLGITTDFNSGRNCSGFARWTGCALVDVDSACILSDCHATPPAPASGSVAVWFHLTSAGCTPGTYTLWIYWGCCSPVPFVNYINGSLGGCGSPGDLPPAGTVAQIFTPDTISIECDPFALEYTYDLETGLYASMSSCCHPYKLFGPALTVTITE